MHQFWKREKTALSPYLRDPGRLGDVIAAIQAMATYKFYKLSDRVVDREARLRLVEHLGHARESVGAAYLGAIRHKQALNAEGVRQQDLLRADGRQSHRCKAARR